MKTVYYDPVATRYERCTRLGMESLGSGLVKISEDTNTSTKRKRVDPEHDLHLALTENRVFPRATSALYADQTISKTLATEQMHDLTTSFSNNTSVPLPLGGGADSLGQARGDFGLGNVPV